MNDYNVLIIFFNNIERFKKSFDAICAVKPKTLFLYQDGPRNDADLIGIQNCREYVEKKIDWDCRIYKLYQSKNYGCDPSNYIAQKWAFSIVDKCIVLEDDDVCSPQFFKFCWELLLKYENDERIAMICGMNNLDEYNSIPDSDYFFSSGGSIWTWGSWKRFIDTWDENYTWLDDNNRLKVIRQYFPTKKRFNAYINLAKKRRLEGKAYYETIMSAAQMLNHQLNIIPSKNLISNIGNDGGVHSGKGNAAIPPKMRSLYYKKTHNIGFPLRHPNYIFDDIEYKEKIYKINTLNLFESIIHKIRRIINNK